MYRACDARNTQTTMRLGTPELFRLDASALSLSKRNRWLWDVLPHFSRAWGDPSVRVVNGTVAVNSE